MAQTLLDQTPQGWALLGEMGAVTNSININITK